MQTLKEELKSQGADSVFSPGYDSGKDQRYSSAENALVSYGSQSTYDYIIIIVIVIVIIITVITIIITCSLLFLLFMLFIL